MLKDIEQVFDEIFIAHKKEIKKIENSCCATIDISSFYYDDITRDFFKTIQVGDLLRSMDIIHFDLKNNILIFGEMTSYGDYASANVGRSSEDCMKWVRSQLLDNGLRNKIIHSIFTLIKIIDYYKLDKHVYLHLFDTSKIKIKNYLILDITYDEYIYLEFSCLDKLEKHKKNRIEGEINILNCEAFNDKLA